MSSKCPMCQTPLKDDYGMATCPGCGSIVFVDMDGLAQVSLDEPRDVTPAPVAFEPEDVAAIERSGLKAIPLDNPMSGPMSADSFPPIEPMPMPSPEAMTPEAVAPGPDPVVPDSSEVDMNAFLGYAPENSPGGAMPVTSSQNDPKDPLGLSAYANSEMSAAKNGPLVVTLIISGIDAKDLRGEIRQALQDSRFGWDTAALMSSIKGGILRIEQVSPVKATIIINRIKNLSVRIRWEQSAINEIDPSS